MKMNCQIMGVAELGEIAANIVTNETGKTTFYKGDSCFVTKDGRFRFVYADDKGVFGEIRYFTANELAYAVDMPRWEVVGVDNCGDDELAILFYEEN